MSDFSFRLMSAAFDVLDFLFPHVARRAASFGIREGMTVVDYGCGPGRYTVPFSRLVGPAGKVYAVDIQQLALEHVRRRAGRLGLANITPVLARGYSSAVPDHTADVVCAIDMFFYINDPAAFLAELWRIARPDGMLIIDDGHQRRSVTKRKLAMSGHWRINSETRDHLECRPEGGSAP